MRFNEEKHLYGVNILYFLLFGNCVFGNETLFEISFQLCFVQQYGKLHKDFVQIKNVIITKLWYRKVQNKFFTLRPPLSCLFQVFVLFQVQSEERGKGFSETS